MDKLYHYYFLMGKENLYIYKDRGVKYKIKKVKKLKPENWGCCL